MKSNDDLLSKVNSMAALNRAIRAFQELRRVTSATLCSAAPTLSKEGLVWQSLDLVLLRLSCGRLGAEEKVHGTIGVLDDVASRGAVRITIQ